MTAPVLTHAPDTLVAVSSVVLGELQLPESSIISFADGLHGFEAHKKFALVPAARDGLFWMQSLAHRDIVFLLIDPFSAAPGYEVDLGAQERLALGLSNPDDVLVLSIVTFAASPDVLPTANLRGPVVFNIRTRMARQVVTTDEAHDVRMPVDLMALPERA